MKQLEGEGAKKTLEVAELQERVRRDETNEEMSKKQTFGLKQKVGKLRNIHKTKTKGVRNFYFFQIIRWLKPKQTGTPSKKN